MDDIDLYNANLFISDAFGVFIPQYFSESIIRENVCGISDEDYKILSQGPEANLYWETWEAVLDNAVININGKTHHLYQDGDLWIVPNEEIF